MSYNKSLLSSIHHPLKKAQGGGSMIEGRPTVKAISQMPNKKYTPSDAVMSTKGVLAGLSMIPVAGYPASIANAVYDFGTGVKYAADGQWDKATEDISQGILGLLPTAVLTGLGLKGNKIYKQLRGLKAMKAGSDMKSMSEAPELSEIFNKSTGRQQYFKSGEEVSSISRRRSVPEPDYTDYGNPWLKNNDPFDPNAQQGLPNIGGGMTTKMPKKKAGGVIIDPLGQWAHPGKVTRIPSNQITMEGVPYPVVGVSDLGDIQMMYPGQDYSFDGSSVTEYPVMASGGQHGGLDRWFAEKWVDIKTGKACGRQEGEKRKGYPACRPSRRVSSETPKTSSELSSAEREKFKREKTSSERINYQHRRKEDGGEINDQDMANKPNNPELWSRAKSLAKEKFDVYPSAYANGWAAKYYKSKGGTWRKAEYGMEIPYMANGGEPQNEGFQALPQAVQEKILDNMAFGGYLPQMAVGGWAQQAAIAIAMKKEGKKPKTQMGAGGTNNPGFQALPEFVQAKILSNMADGGKMPADIARARFAAAGNEDKLAAYGYAAYGGMMPVLATGGEPNGSMAMGQMAAVSDKMNKLLQFVNPQKNLDPWIASKLAVMDHSADAISDYLMYGPESQEQEMEKMANGGYTVTRSNDRKGKTHKVTGPDGTVKYFGDSKLGQHPKDPERKKAFYARHKKNLAANPYFRAFARATWADGGTYMAPNFFEMGGDVMDVTPAEAERLRQQGYQFEIIG